MSFVNKKILGTNIEITFFINHVKDNLIVWKEVFLQFSRKIEL